MPTHTPSEQLKNISEDVTGPLVEQPLDNRGLVKEELTRMFPAPVVQALMANIDVETNGTFDPLQQQFKGGPGRGLMQFEGPMLDALRKAPGSDTIGGQVQFLESILQGDERFDIGAGNRAKLNKVFKTGTPEEISDMLVKRLLRPGKPNKAKRNRALEN